MNQIFDFFDNEYKFLNQELLKYSKQFENEGPKTFCEDFHEPQCLDGTFFYQLQYLRNIDDGWEGLKLWPHKEKISRINQVISEYLMKFDEKGVLKEKFEKHGRISIDNFEQLAIEMNGDSVVFVVSKRN